MKLIFSLLFIALLLIPGVQSTAHIFPEVQLTNVDKRVRFPNFTWRKFRKGRFTNAFDDWMTKTSGFYGAMVRFNNSLNFNLGVPTPPYRGEVVIAKDGVLLTSLSIKDLNGLIILTEEKIDLMVKGISKLQSQLAKKGTPLLVVISPDKAAIHPDDVPWRLYSDKPGVRLIDRFRPKFEEYGVNHLIIADHLKEQGVRYYSKTGAHLNRFGACLATSALSRKLNELKKGGYFPNISCSRMDSNEPPSKEDLDLARLLNVYDTKITKELQPGVAISSTKGAAVDDILIIGSSNLFGILGTMHKVKAMGSHDFYFYTKTLYHCDKIQKSGKQPCSKRKIDKERDFSPSILNNRSAVILEVPQARLHQLGFGKIESLLQE